MSQRTSSGFERLDPRLQRWIWQQNWNELRDIQEQTIAAVFDDAADVIVASATASGKTEAAFLPIASSVANQVDTGLAVLCISPLKALINDQYDRLKSMFDSIDVPVHRWHGDVPAGAKTKLLAGPHGVVLITPESLEALFVRRGTRMPALARDLKCVVVDELHAFIGTERGRQLQSLLSRLELAARHRIRRVGLSATLGDMNIAAEYMRPGGGDQVRKIVSGISGQEVKLQVRGYCTTRVRDENARANREAETATSSEPGDEVAIARDLYAKLRGGRHIVFTNRRADVETYTNLLRSISDHERTPNEFWPHHGSLDKSLREDAETSLKTASRPATIIATTTLELGIDVGAVESVAQIGPPAAVASLRQRLGRSGRRGDPAVMRIYIREIEIDPQTPPQDQLRLGLIQTIAMVKLLAKRWYEPPAHNALHLSTLVQQILSVIAQHGGASASDAYAALCRAGPFKDVAPDTFGRLLRDLASHQLITQTHDDLLVMDMEGEHLVNQFDFYAAFQSGDEYRLVAGSRTLGTLPITFPLYAGVFIIFGGSRWRVTHVDDRRRIVELVPAPGGRAPSFGGSGTNVHDRVRAEMRNVLKGAEVPEFLDPTATDLLAEARANFRRFELDRRSIVRASSGVLVFPWVGDRALNTLAIILKRHGLTAAAENGILRVDDVSENEMAGIIKDLSDAQPPSGFELAETVVNRIREKHHVFLSPELLAADYASSEIDVSGALVALRQSSPDFFRE